MDLEGSRFLVAGATGTLGGAVARELAGADARVALAGRDAEHAGALGEELGAPAVALDLREPTAAVAGAAEALGGLDGLVVAVGAVAFGPAAEVGDDVVRALFEVNALGPIGLVRAAVEWIEPPGAVAVLSAIVAEHPTAGMAAYSASKAAVSAYLAALRRERRRDGLVVLDVRPQHLDTGFEGRALAGSPPPLPAPGDHREVAAAIVGALRDDARELAYDLKARGLVSR